MLAAILVLYFQHGAQTGRYTFDLLELYKFSLPLNLQIWLFLAFGLAFAIKVPMFPFHTWLPDAHTEAPTVGSVLLAAVLLKMGTYGFLRFSIPLFPHASYQLIPLVSILAIIGIVYGALVCLVQKDLKRLIAFSSVSHLGFVMLGLFALNLQGIEGGILQMLNHGFSTGALFLLVGMIYERRHTRLIEEFGGLWKQMPIFASFFMVVTLSSIGLPGSQRVRGGVFDFSGRLQSRQGLRRHRRHRDYFGRGLYALDVPTGHVRGCQIKKVRRIFRAAKFCLPPTLFIFWIGISQTFLSRMEPTVKGYLVQVTDIKRDESPGRGEMRLAAQPGNQDTEKNHHQKLI
jgi:NADH-quinone oxidoreductase subunit M